jgi:hypothetical protein
MAGTWQPSGNVGSVAHAYAEARQAQPGPGEANKQQNEGQSRTGHFNDSVGTSRAANDSTAHDGLLNQDANSAPDSPSATKAPAWTPPTDGASDDAKKFFPRSIQKNEKYAQVQRDTQSNTRPAGYASNRHGGNKAPIPPSQSGYGNGRGF